MAADTPARRAGRPPRAAASQHRHRRGDRAACRRCRPGRAPARRALPATTSAPARPRRRQRAAVLTRLIGRDIGFAAPVAFSGEQVPGALGLGQLAAAAELPEVQVRLGDPAPPFGPPVREGSRVKVGHAAGAGQLIDIGGDPLQYRGHPGQVGRHQRPARVIAVGDAG